MSILIHVDGFELSAEDREQIERRLTLLLETLPPGSRLHLLLKPIRKGSMEATLLAYGDYREWIATGTGNQVINLVNSVELHLRRRVHDMKTRRRVLPRRDRSTRARDIS